ncbi:GNAT family N-acetyltransferase [Desulfofundulus sp. TPOSR]|uniref:GNAT family N-acetyltransferase n=1 Tax=Desulfofundulus sp. TPOSR TaxID=2714340 RepID=UPI00140A9E56|nr:GNAT family N-acetyltransferase [Desulfofundulus sp. TPOSR]NHM27402.1 GNAT family N-acetyltransferase [Desulfofundulus sp. TPOSR]
MITASAKITEIKQLTTPQGMVIIEGPVSKEYLASLTMNERLRNFRSPARQKEALMIAAADPEGLVYIARYGHEIIGYVLFHRPSEYTRWSRHPRLLELGAIEVSRSWQRLGIAKELLKQAFKNEMLEDYVVITTEFYWHWDLEGSGLDAFGYQRMLTRLFGSAGFKRRGTDDPEILEHPANMLMVRFGKRISKTHVKAFEALTYQNSLVD